MEETMLTAVHKLDQVEHKLAVEVE